MRVLSVDELVARVEARQETSVPRRRWPVESTDYDGVCLAGHPQGDADVYVKKSGELACLHCRRGRRSKAQRPG